MSDGDFTKEEAATALLAVRKLYASLSTSKKMELVQEFNCMCSFIEAARRRCVVEELKKEPKA